MISESNRDERADRQPDSAQIGEPGISAALPVCLTCGVEGESTDQFCSICGATLVVDSDLPVNDELPAGSHAAAQGEFSEGSSEWDGLTSTASEPPPSCSACGAPRGSADQFCGTCGANLAVVAAALPVNDESPVTSTAPTHGALSEWDEPTSATSEPPSSCSACGAPRGS